MVHVGAGHHRAAVSGAGTVTSGNSLGARIFTNNVEQCSVFTQHFEIPLSFTTPPINFGQTARDLRKCISSQFTAASPETFPRVQVCSRAVLAMTSLVAPLVYRGDYRPFFAIYDPDFRHFQACHFASKNHKSGLDLLNIFACVGQCLWWTRFSFCCNNP